MHMLMVNLIEVGNATKILTGSISIAILFFGSCSSVNYSKGASVLKIDFQDFFKGDTISLSINDCSIFSNQIFTSDQSDGFTGRSVELFKEDKLAIVIRFLDKDVRCSNRRNSILKFTVNGTFNEFTIDSRKGKYIGFSKIDSNRLLMKQSSRAFLYD